MNILVTGSKGFIGRNFVNYLRLNTSHKVFEFSRNNKFTELENLILVIDKVFHFAGSNNNKDINDLEKVNIALTKKLCDVLKKNPKTDLYYASSSQALLNNSYGSSKKKAEDICIEFEQVCKNKVYILRLPGIFGSGCKPNYNSVVSTFCYNVVNRYPLKIIDPYKKIELIFIDDLCKQLNHLINTKNYGQLVALNNKYKISIKELASIIKEFENLTSNNNMQGNLGDFKKKLYKTYLSFKN
jgi:UDP-2-acetamido-2,6-beta-L-arabino-hexul-4-ose reductase